MFRNLKLADNAIGYTHASGRASVPACRSYTSKVVDSLFVGETENIGNPTTAAEKAYGRSLPKPVMPDFPIRGYEYYDFRHDVVNITFRNYEDNATRKTGAISYLLYTSFGVSSNNAVESAKFVNAKPVYFPPMVPPSGATTTAAARLQDRVVPATRTARSAAVRIPTCSSISTASTTASRSSRTPARSSPPGTLRSARAISDASMWPPRVVGPVVRTRASRRCRSGRWRTGCAAGAPAVAAAAGAPAPAAAGAAAPARTCSASRWRLRRTGPRPAARRPQPQWQGLHPDRHQRARRHRDQGDDRKADRVSRAERAG